MKISKNLNRCDLSPMRKFHPLAVNAVKAGKRIYHLNIGQPDIPTPGEYFDAVKQFDEKTLAYAASPGVPVLIDAIRDYYKKMGIEYDSNDIYITTGGSEALMYTCLSILDPGTEVIVPEPYYPNYNTFISAAGGVIRPMPTRPEDGYRYADREDLEKLIEAYGKRHLENPGVIVDTNHANSGKKYLEQVRISKEILHSMRHSNEIKSMVKGLMIESYIEDGAQKVDEGCYGKSITDPCLGWEKSERLVLDIADLL